MTEAAPCAMPSASLPPVPEASPGADAAAAAVAVNGAEVQSRLERTLDRIDRLLEDDAFWAAREVLYREREAILNQDRMAVEAVRRRRQVEHIPSRYRETFDASRSPYDPRVLAALARWEPSVEGLGIGLVGRSGLGKTRLLCQVLLRLRCSWLYLPAAQLSDLVAERWSDDPRTAAEARDLLGEARSTRVLYLDDLGDERRTDAVSEELKDLVETRTSLKRPILWSSNLSEQEMRERHGTRGAAIVRRLSEFCWTV